jgi:hypothetical protein
MAKALDGVGRKEDALGAIKKEKNMDADLLRAKIYWGKKDWPRAAQAMRRLLRHVDAKPGDTLDETQGRYVLDMAIALTLSANERGLDRVRRDYGAAMQSGTYRDAFRLIASPQTLGLIDYRTIASKVSDVENFRDFLSAYSARVKEEGLSAIN